MGILDDYLMARASRENPYFGKRLNDLNQMEYALLQGAIQAKALSSAIGVPGTPVQSQQSVQSQQPAQSRQAVQSQQSANFTRLSPEDTEMAIASYRPSAAARPYYEHIIEAARHDRIDPQNIEQLINVESSFKPRAQSPTGPKGLMQVSKAAAQDAGYGGQDMYDPRTNIRAGTSYLGQQIDRFGSDALKAFHDGPGAVAAGNISPEALAYDLKVRGAKDTQQGAYTEQPNTPMPVYRAESGSQYLPNRLEGGSGLLAQDMDPNRKSWYEAIKSLVESGDPELVSFGMAQLGKMQEAQMKAIEPTATMKDALSMGLNQGTPSYNDYISRTSMKPNQSITIGDPNASVKLPEGMMWNADHSALAGIPGGPKDPKNMVLTEAQGKGVEYYTKGKLAHDTLVPLENSAKFNPAPLDAIRNIETIPLFGPWVSSASQYGLSNDQKTALAAERTFINAILRLESGASISGTEFYNAHNQYFRTGSDGPEQVAFKQKLREQALRGLDILSGPGGEEYKRTHPDDFVVQFVNNHPELRLKDGRLDGIPKYGSESKPESKPQRKLPPPPPDGDWVME